MSRIDFLISNDRHHLAMTLPVAEKLIAEGRHRLRILSLCELRGLKTPDPDRMPAGVEVRRLFPGWLRRSPSTGPSGRPGPPSRSRRVVRGLIWRSLLAPGLAWLLVRRPDLVALPNDAAFPYDRIARRLRRRRIPFLLLQEGIRFPLVGRTGEAVYGAGGAAAVAAWGETSGEYFRRVGVSPERIHLTGSPRFDRSPAAREAPSRGAPPARRLLLATNPIDDQGLCTHQEKLELVRRFLDGAAQFLADGGLHLDVKLHGRESADEMESLIPDRLRSSVVLHTTTPLPELFATAAGAIVLASTVGLEALLHGVPLAVLEIPGRGFQYDYVESGAAAGLTWDVPLAPQLASLLEPSQKRLADVDAYLQRQFAGGGSATVQVVELIRDLTEADR